MDLLNYISIIIAFLISLNTIDQVTSISCAYCTSVELPECATLNFVPGEEVSTLPSITCSDEVQFCYTYINDDGDTIRGCEPPPTPIGGIECTESEYCNECDTDDCNNMIFPLSRPTCHQCTGLTCDGFSQIIPEYPCTKYTETQENTCFIHITEQGIITRGCSIDHPELDCNNSDECEQCNDNNCNSRIITTNCITCEGGELLCVEQINEAMTETCSNDLNDLGCYAYITDDYVARGCVASLNETMTTICASQNEQCKICQGNNCNMKQNFQSCHVCESELDFNCITADNEIDTKICINYMDTCKSIVIEGGYTERGCSLELEHIPCEDDQLCNVCDLDNCNNELFPRGRPRCHQCIGYVNCERVLTSNLPSFLPCSIYNSEETCYVYVNETNEVTYRGCMSDGTPESEICTNLAENCYTCVTSVTDTEPEFACNNQISVTVPTLNCIQCSVDDEECPWGYPFEAATPCVKHVLFPRIETCFTYKHENESVTRGCTLDTDITECSENDVDCLICNEVNGCNQHNVRSQYCLQCTTYASDQLECGDDDPPLSFTGECSTEWYPYSERGCYTRNRNGLMDRGCYMELFFEDEKLACKTGANEQCIYCDESDNCNNVPVPEHPLSCTVCNSSELAVCATMNFYEGQTLPSAICPGENATCYAYISPEGDTIRGCDSPTENGCEGVANCNECQVDYCNSYDFPTLRVKCQQCIGFGCDGFGLNVPSYPCTKFVGYGETADTCFIYAEQGLIIRGCLVDYSQLNCTEESTVCERCNGVDCNSRFVMTNWCIGCNSEIDEYCKYEIPLGGDYVEQCPSSLNELGCYTYMDAGELALRGCLSSLSTYELDYCMSPGTECKACDGNFCNEKIDFQKCIKCSSTNLTNTTNCLNPIESTELDEMLVTCTDYFDECFVHVANNIVTRDCLSDMPAFISDCENPKLCEKCGFNNSCNIEPIIEIETCIQCNTDNIADCRYGPTPETLSTECNYGIQPMGCYKIDDGGIIFRGCLNKLTDFEIDYCNEQISCEQCLGNNCNREHLKCLTCTGVDECMNLSESDEIFCEDYTDSCFTHISRIDSVVTRGCLYQAIESIQSDCLSNNRTCEMCVGPNCNDKIIEVETCIACDLNTEENCRDDPPVTEIDCPLVVEKHGCYLYKDSATVSRGCVSSLNESLITRCLTQGTDCKTCIGRNCNEKIDYQSCEVCHSSTNLNCATIGTVTMTKICTNYVDTCISFIDEDGHTVRGCTLELNPLACGDNEDLCNVCYSENCNNQIIPENRPRCYKCMGLVECRTMSNPNQNHLPCNRFNMEEMCYVYIDDDEVTYRGCISDETLQSDRCTELSDNCYKCQTSMSESIPETSCNNAISLYSPTLNCIKCESNSEDCAWGYLASDAALCTANVRYPRIESCYTLTHTNNTVSRGCTLDTPQICENYGGLCEICTSNSGCNNENVLLQLCLTCSSDVIGQETCADDSPSNNFRRECVKDVYGYDERGCFTRNNNGIIERGCTMDLSIEDQDNCKDETYIMCEHCEDGNNCNNQKAPSGASTLAIGSISILSLIFLCRII